MDNMTLNKMIELASKGITDTDSTEYFQDITPKEAYNRFRFLLEYNDIDYKEISIISTKPEEFDFNLTGFYIKLDDYKNINMHKFPHYFTFMSGELDDKVFIGFKEKIQSDLDKFLEALRVLTDDSDEVNNIIHSYKLFKGTHQYDVYAIHFNNEKLEKINDTYLS